MNTSTSTTAARRHDPRYCSFRHFGCFLQLFILNKTCFVKSNESLCMCSQIISLVTYFILWPKNIKIIPMRPVETTITIYLNTTTTTTTTTTVYLYPLFRLSRYSCLCFIDLMLFDKTRSENCISVFHIK